MTESYERDREPREREIDAAVFERLNRELGLLRACVNMADVVIGRLRVEIREGGGSAIISEGPAMRAYYEARSALTDATQPSKGSK